MTPESAIASGYRDRSAGAVHRGPAGDVSRRALLGGAAAAAGAALLGAAPSASAAAPAGPRLLRYQMQDRWLETDLAFFDPEQVSRSASQWWDRLAPLYSGAAGEIGVLINVGWHIDYITNWTGTLADPIDMHYFNIFGGRRWTYAQLRALVTALREEGNRRLGRGDYQVGTYALGWRSLYETYETPFYQRHSEAYNPWWFAWTHTLSADSYTYGAYPGGIPAGTPVSTFFGRQLASLSQAIGTDVFELRDGMFGRTDYDPSSISRGWDPAYDAALRNGLATVKQASPRLKIMAYNTAMSGIAELRENYLDFEGLARAGLIDYYVSQTWGVAWNDYYKATAAGLTMEAQYALTQHLQLFGTNTKFYPLFEVYDAYEQDWITIAPNNQRWEVWTYSHLAARDAGGNVRVPDGCYIAWVNGPPPGQPGDTPQAASLIPASVVAGLQATINAAAADARKMTDAHGASLVYDRDFLVWANQNSPATGFGEIADEHLGMITKSAIPVMSGTRIENLTPRSAGELPVFSTPSQLTAPERATAAAIIQHRPAAVFGSSDAVDPELQGSRTALYFDPPDYTNSQSPGPAAYEPVVDWLRGQLAAQKQSHIAAGSPYGVLNLWQSAGRPRIHLANVSEPLLETPADHTYTLKLSRSQLGIPPNETVTLTDYFTGATITPTGADQDWITFQVTVPLRDSRLLTVS